MGEANDQVTAERKAALLNALGMGPLRDWDDIVNAARCIRGERDAVRRSISRVRDLHYMHPMSRDRGGECDYCGEPWPCPTIAALNGTDGVDRG